MPARKIWRRGGRRLSSVKPRRIVRRRKRRNARLAKPEKSSSVVARSVRKRQREGYAGAWDVTCCVCVEVWCS